MYTTRNFKTKKELKAAVAAWNAYQEAKTAAPALSIGAVLASKIAAPAVTYYQPGPFGGNEPQNGTFCCEGPHYPQPHRWYATCTAEGGVIVRVK